VTGIRAFSLERLLLMGFCCGVGLGAMFMFSGRYTGISTCVRIRELGVD
jgi:hypothetical protein